MTAPAPIDPRAAQVAVIMLDTRVSGRYIPRDAYRKAPPMSAATAARIAVRLSDAAGQTVTADEIVAAARVLRTQTPTRVLREMVLV